MGFTVRFLLGTALFLLCFWTLHSTPIKNEDPQDEKNKSFVANLTEENKPKTDFSTDNKTIIDKQNSVVGKLQKAESYKKSQEIGRSIDIEKYVSKDFHNKNNVYTLTVSPDTEKYIESEYDFHETTQKHDFEFDFHNTELTTPKSSLFDHRFKEAVESVDQKLEHIDDSHEISAESESKENVNLEKLYDETTKNDTKADLNYINYKNIISNDTGSRNSLHKDLVVEAGTNLDFRSTHNHTIVIDEDDSRNNTIVKDEKKAETSTLSNVIPVKGDLDNAESSSKSVIATTRKSITLTKPPSNKNSSHISILSNNIETETVKAITHVQSSTEKPKGEVEEASEHFSRRIEVEKRPFMFTDAPRTEASNSDHINKKSEQLQQENQVIPVHVPPPATKNATKEAEEEDSKEADEKKATKDSEEKKDTKESGEKKDMTQKEEISMTLPTTRASVIEVLTTEGTPTTSSVVQVLTTTERPSSTTLALPSSSTTTPTPPPPPPTTTTTPPTTTTTELVTTTESEATPEATTQTSEPTTQTIETETETSATTPETSEATTENSEPTTIISATTKESELETLTSVITETSISPWEKATFETTKIDTTTGFSAEKTTQTTEPETTFASTYQSDSTAATLPDIVTEVTTPEITTTKKNGVTTENTIRTSKEMVYKETPETTTIEISTKIPCSTIEIETTTETKKAETTPMVRVYPEYKHAETAAPEIETTTENNTITSDFYEHTDPPEDNSGTIAAITISSIGAVCLILVAGLLVIMRKRQKRLTYGQRCTPVSLDDYSMDNVSVYNSVRRKGMMRGSKRSYGNPAFEDPVCLTHPLNFPALGKFANNLEDIKAEFEDIPLITARTNELPEGCDTKNRYANVIPLPETRVFLNLIDGYPNSDYINANYVTGPKNTKGYYIACQAPLQNTVDDFWRMVWEQQCKVVLMLTHLFENGVEKCVDYLPPSEVLDCHRLFGDFQVTLKKREVKDKYIISSLQLKNMVSNSWREVTHFWYLGWPEKGVPIEANSLIAFLIEARSYMKSASLDRKEVTNGNLTNGMAKNEQNPVVVHCSPGTGRTGVVIACDIAIREFEQSRLVDVPRIVYKIRRDRASAVQTKEQYAFIYKVVNLYATKLTGGALDSL